MYICPWALALQGVRDRRHVCESVVENIYHGWFISWFLVHYGWTTRYYIGWGLVYPVSRSLQSSLLTDWGGAIAVVDCSVYTVKFTAGIRPSLPEYLNRMSGFCLFR